jgi:ParG
MTKTVNFKMGQRPVPANVEEWVQSARPVDREVRPAVPAEAMKRFTIDVPTTLHTRIKTECARRGVKMADMLRELLEREFPKA